jgi:hypothetical protein
VRLVRIEGPDETVRGLRDIADLILVSPSTEILDGGRISMAAYATGRAVALIEGRGATVRTVIDDAELKERFAELDALIETEEPPLVG